MASKVTPAVKRAIFRMAREGRSVREIEEALRAKHGDGAPKKSTIAETLKLRRDDPPAPTPAPVAAAPTAPSSPTEVPDDSEMTPAEFTAWLTAQLRGQQSAAETSRAVGDMTGAQRAMRLAAQLAALLQRQHARTADDGDVVRVRAADMQAAAERALAGLQQTADAVLGEVATWPRCAACGEAHGTFADTDRSPIRALFERLARRVG